jgi:prepilin-type N-terminal cleavage/methylation domain-containing protein
MSRVRRSDESGFTLSEVCIALVIVAVAITSIIGSLGTAMFATKVHRDIASSDSVVREYAEQLVGAAYVACGAPNAYPQMTDVPADFTATIVKVEYWNGSNTNAQFVAGCTTDSGAQRLTLRASRANGAGVQTLQIVKRAS